MIHTQAEFANIWLITHSLNTISPTITTWIDQFGTIALVMPREVAVIDENTVRVMFTSPQSGGCAISNSPANALTYTHTQSLSSKNWTVSHNLGSHFTNLDVIVLVDGKYQTIWPASVTAPDENTIAITFSTPMSGFVRVGV